MNRLLFGTFDIELSPNRVLTDCFCLVCFSFKVPESELELSTNITQAWDDLFVESRRVDASLVSVKKKFTEVRVAFVTIA